MGVKDRLRRLEGDEPEGCPLCAEWLGDAPEGGAYEVLWDDPSLYEGEPPQDSGFDVPEYCPRCGEQLVYTVTWDDD